MIAFVLVKLAVAAPVIKNVEADMKVEKKVTEICGNEILKQRLSELVYYT